MSGIGKCLLVVTVISAGIYPLTPKCSKGMLVRGVRSLSPRGRYKLVVQRRDMQEMQGQRRIEN